MSSHFLSVIIPVFNEEEIISESIEHWIKTLKPFNKSFELIIGDDGSTDSTRRLIKEAESKHKQIKFISNQVNIGRGKIIKMCLDLACSDKILCTDADLVIDSIFINDILDKLERADIVISSKHLKGARIKHPKIRRILSLIYNILTNLLFNQRVSDYQCGVKAFNRNALDQLGEIKSDSWSWDTELIITSKRKKISIEEIPLVADVYGRKSRLRNKDVFSIFLGLIKLKIGHGDSS